MSRYILFDESTILFQHLQFALVLISFQNCYNDLPYNCLRKNPFLFAPYLSYLGLTCSNSTVSVLWSSFWVENSESVQRKQIPIIFFFFCIFAHSNGFCCLCFNATCIIVFNSSQGTGKEHYQILPILFAVDLYLATAFSLSLF